MFLKNDFFTCSEFDSPDVIGSGSRMSDSFMIKLISARRLAGVVFRISSGYRTTFQNSLVGGVSDSSHLRGLACDIVCSGALSRKLILFALMSVGFRRVIVYDTFIHVDDDYSKVEGLFIRV